ncbi:MAG TPA: carbonic anhydrase [Acidimicrobiales bacterium]|nr:carbonic anhydrase [Acidimicrobiales bacterium]
MSATDRLLVNAEQRAADVATPNLPGRPAQQIAIVSCMDARLDPSAIFGLGPGDAHVLRNAGGAVTDDVIRSLALSQRLLDTREIVLVHHTRCGMMQITDESFAHEVQADTGIRPPWSAEAFSDLEDELKQCMARVRSSPFLPCREAVRGFVYDVDTGRLTEVQPG